MNKTDNPLKKFITSKLYSRYSGILSLSDVPLFLVDTNGDILLEFIPSPDFCTHVCQERESHVCPEYQCRLQSGKEGRFVCRYGLENMIFPIIVDNKTVGYMAGIQVYLKDNEYKKYMINVQSPKETKTEELEFIAKSIFSLKSVESNKIKVYERLCCEIAKNISLDLSESTKLSHQDVKRLSIEKEILEKKIIDLESKNMSLVVNPHFLFNTLNCIARVAYFEHSHETEELIYCLSDLLRYNLKQGNQLHTIGAEINNIEKYLYIQKVRFKTRLEYDINISENLKSYRILNMIIQPIVENSVIHGITPRRDGGKISIYAEKYKEEIVISIMDNGNGFPKDVLLNIQQCENKSGLGFQSTDKRLKQYYGKQYGLKIVKSDYSGSTVTITIPAEPIVR
ncbi:histidine kinase [Clostridium ljungdahlii]|uniref:Sensor histidine kinase YehU n=1 Tax=Clostridium ljungdahlii TaxID=1538 RepID=A0A162L1V3_9CLOT|nr:histidine kinase [Clostridium ljungdahlii]OAA89982.1 Sensor histidine kinase YehU [Clostridium ljungdahlii]